MTVDTRLLVYLIWGIGTVLVYGVTLRRVVTFYRRFPDKRSRGDLLSAIGLFVTALGASLAITLVLFGPAGGGVRGFFVALALGAFSAAGLVMATDKDD